MTVQKLIEVLKEMPQNAEVWHLWDGEIRTQIEIVYVSKSGVVVTSDFDKVCYSDESRPVDAPSKDEDKYWSTPKTPNPLVHDDEDY